MFRNVLYYITVLQYYTRVATMFTTFVPHEGRNGSIPAEDNLRLIDYHEVVENMGL